MDAAGAVPGVPGAGGRHPAGRVRGLRGAAGGELPLRNPGLRSRAVSPFRGLDWAGAGALRFRFVSTAERVDACDGEDARAAAWRACWACASPSLTLSGGLRAAHAVRGVGAALPGAAAGSSPSSTPSRTPRPPSARTRRPRHVPRAPRAAGHGQIHREPPPAGQSCGRWPRLMALERHPLRHVQRRRRHAQGRERRRPGQRPADVNVEPQQTHAMQQQQQSVSSPVLLSRDAATFGSASPTLRSSGATGPSFTSIPSPLAAGVTALDPRNRRRKRQLARREKLLGDYSVLDKFSTELVEKASEAVALYAKAGTVELESLLIENLGWYYAAVSTATLRRSSMAGEAKVLESLWTKRLLWDVLERGLVLFPELQSQRQVEFLVQTSRMLETVGHRRRVALFLHEAASFCWHETRLLWILN
ncbi:Targeting complex (TRAPP) subunit [Phytophthora cinnamomi]|uniref:Targeting complex (TRAPP) subunit n=1 Tax=Phytophthora cinnamomi TaxID=4785 RepID=UPI0035596C4A|nr:Targeting complex (TRAPP) subunit [Phytophthora cinnamomi]